MTTNPLSPDELVSRLRELKDYRLRVYECGPDIVDFALHEAAERIEALTKRIEELEAWLKRVCDEYEDTEYYQPDTLKIAREVLARSLLQGMDK